MALGKTAWVDRTVNEYYQSLLEVVPPDLMPTIEGMRRGMDSFEEYGCGLYGCVMPTTSPYVVLKLTTDETEAKFAQYALDVWEANDETPEVWQGLVQYYGVVKLRTAKIGRTPIYALWREAADNIGFLADPETQELDRPFIDNLGWFKQSAQQVRAYLERSRNKPRSRELMQQNENKARDIYMRGAAGHYRGALNAAVNLQICLVSASVLSDEEFSHDVGEALLQWIGMGALLCDVHLFNVGTALRPTPDGRSFTSVNVITDPGQCMDLTGWSDELQIRVIDPVR